MVFKLVQSQNQHFHFLSKMSATLEVKKIICWMSCDEGVTNFNSKSIPKLHDSVVKEGRVVVALYTVDTQDAMMIQWATHDADTV